MEIGKTRLALSASMLALALALAGCGGGGSGSTVQAPGGGSGGSGPPDQVEETQPSTGMVSSVPQTTGLAAAVAGGRTSLQIAAGMSRTVGGVMFMCAAGEDACMVTLAMAGGVLTANWEGGEVTAAFVDPLENMNEANEAKIAAIMSSAIGAAEVGAIPGPAQPAGADNDAMLGGLKSGGTIGPAMPVTENAGADNINGVTLTGNFDPNEAMPTLRAMADTSSTPQKPSHYIGMEQAGALGLMGWSHKVLHADWGDGAGGLDAGIETATLIYSDMESTSVAFSALATTLVDATLRSWFDLSLNFGTGEVTDGSDATDDPNNAVDIEDASTAATQVEHSLVSPTGQAFQALVAQPDDGDVIVGEYFGVSGMFKCADTDCRISRDDDGSTPFELSDGRWLFMPDDASEMVNIPDQDWLAFGVWLTAPDNMADGHHNIGVFYDGMEEYDATNAPDGTATFAGKAAGYYVNGTAHGLFTADAALTATFANNSGTLMGTIQNFRDSQGRYIDSDNPNTPNDVNHGGENDWGVVLRSTDLNDAGTFDSAGMTSGTADGVSWMGDWTAQLYGPGGRLDPVEAPTGVAGDFRAITGELTGGGHKGVVGAFGAERTPQ